jgi:phage-related protein
MAGRYGPLEPGASLCVSVRVHKRNTPLPGWTRSNAFVNIAKMEWEIAYYSEVVQQTIMAFPAGIQARYIHLTQRMVVFGPHLGMPHTRSLGKGLFELRMKSKEGIGRVFFGALPNRQVIMLHAFIKKSMKTPRRELQIARARLEEVQTDADAR